MESDIQRLLDTLDRVRSEANVDACFGDPVSVEGRTVIPVARVAYGFGVGAGHRAQAGEEEPGGAEKEKGTEGHGAGGMTSYPLGFIELAPEGIRVRPVVNRQKVAVVGMLVGAWSLFWLLRALTAIFGRRE